MRGFFYLSETRRQMIEIMNFIIAIVALVIQVMAYRDANAHT